MLYRYLEQIFGTLAAFAVPGMVFALHAVWNCMQGEVFGVEVSVVTVVLCSVVTVWAIVQIVRRGVVVPPLWGQRRAPRRLEKAPAQ